MAFDNSPHSSSALSSSADAQKSFLVANLSIILLGFLVFGALAFSIETTVFKVILGVATLTCVLIAYLQLNQLLVQARQLESIVNENTDIKTRTEKLNSTVSNYQQLLQELLPLWHRQTELARNQLEESVNELAKRFSGIHERLQSAVNASRFTAGDMKGNNGLSSVIQFADSELGQMIETLSQAIDLGQLQHSRRINRDTCLKPHLPL